MNMGCYTTEDLRLPQLLLDRLGFPEKKKLKGLVTIRDLEGPDGRSLFFHRVGILGTVQYSIVSIPENAINPGL